MFLSSVSSTTALSCSDLLSLPEKLQHPRVLSAKRNVTTSLVMTMKMTNRVYGFYVENKSTHSLRIHSLEKIFFFAAPLLTQYTGPSLWMRKLIVEFHNLYFETLSALADAYKGSRQIAHGLK